MEISPDLKKRFRKNWSGFTKKLQFHSKNKMNSIKLFNSSKSAWYQPRKLKIEMKRLNAINKSVISRRNLATLKKRSNFWTNSCSFVRKLAIRPMQVRLINNWLKPTLKMEMSRLLLSTLKLYWALLTTSKTSNFKQMHSLNSVSSTTKKVSLENLLIASKSILNLPELTLKRAKTRNWSIRQEWTWVLLRPIQWLKTTSIWYCKIWMDCLTGR